MVLEDLLTWIVELEVRHQAMAELKEPMDSLQAMEPKEAMGSLEATEPKETTAFLEAMGFLEIME